MNVSIIMPYYNNPTMLAKHLDVWSSYRDDQKARLEIVIVDDGSQEDAETAASRWVFEKRHGIGFALQLYKVLEDIPWNQDGARNLAMAKASNEWALMTDMDHVLPAEQVDAMLDFAAVKGTYYMPTQYLADGTPLNRPHPNSYLMNVHDFWSMGGYDEDFAGWYGSDGNFRRCAVGAGLVEKPISNFGLVVYRRTDIPDASTRTLGRKGSEYHVPNNPDLMRKRAIAPYKATNPIRFKYEKVF